MVVPYHDISRPKMQNLAQSNFKQIMRQQFIISSEYSGNHSENVLAVHHRFDEKSSSWMMRNLSRRPIVIYRNHALLPRRRTKRRFFLPIQLTSGCVTLSRFALFCR